MSDEVWRERVREICEWLTTEMERIDVIRECPTVYAEEAERRLRFVQIQLQSVKQNEPKAAKFEDELKLMREVSLRRA